MKIDYLIDRDVFGVLIRARDMRLNLAKKSRFRKVSLDHCLNLTNLV